MNKIEQFEQAQIVKLTQNKVIPNFRVGDNVRVNVKVVEGENERTQAYEGICIARKNAGLNSSFTVRKISFGEGVERVFPLYSPHITVELVRRGVVRRAKLYYLRERRGKSARITERRDYDNSAAKAASAKAASAKAAPAASAEAAPAPETKE